MPVTDSILDTTKKALGIASDYTEFDLDIIMHINSVFSILTQLAVGPPDGFTIADKTPVWNDYISNNKKLSMVRSYMYMRVRLMFDPPETSFARDAFEKKATELEWRLNVEEDTWPHVNVPVVEDSEDEETL